MTRSLQLALLLTATVVLALIFRLPGLEIRPLHNDEANQAIKTGELLDNGIYRYDPVEHHGPVLYYLTLPVALIRGETSLQELSITTLRLTCVLAGVALIPLLWFLRADIPPGALVVSGLLTALSPAMVFYSRFYIQEMLLVFFSCGALVAVWRCFKDRSPGWAVSAGVFLGLMHATKETCIIAFFCIACGLLAAAAAPARADSGSGRGFPGSIPGLVLWGLIAAVVVSVIFFSSFGTNAPGPLDSLLTFKTYFGRAGGGDTLHRHPWSFYFERLFWFRAQGGPLWSEALTGLLALAGIFFAFSPRSLSGVNPSLARMLAVYALLMTLIYALIPYKTPWCVASFLHSLIILAGLGAAGLAGLAGRHLAVVMTLCLIAGLWHLGVQAARANSRRLAADQRNPWVYAQTGMDFPNLVRRVEQAAAVHPLCRRMLIQAALPADRTWPLPWYLRRFERVGYWQKAEEIPAAGDVPVVITSMENSGMIAGRLGDGYQCEYYGLRPGIPLAVFIRRDIWSAAVNEKGSGLNR